jgi:hypothetical protein
LGDALVAPAKDKFRDPARADVRHFADALIFNWLMAGTDAHAKNYSLLLSVNPGPRLAPLYDLASSIPYAEQIDPRKAKLAMKIGRHYRIREVSRPDWDRCALLSSSRPLRYTNPQKDLDPRRPIVG